MGEQSEKEKKEEILARVEEMLRLVTKKPRWSRKGKLVIDLDKVNVIHRKYRDSSRRSFQRNMDKFTREVDYFLVRSPKGFAFLKDKVKYRCFLTRSGYVKMANTYEDDWSGETKIRVLEEYFQRHACPPPAPKEEAPALEPSSPAVPPPVVEEKKEETKEIIPEWAKKVIAELAAVRRVAEEARAAAGDDGLWTVTQWCHVIGLKASQEQKRLYGIDLSKHSERHGLKMDEVKSGGLMVKKYEEKACIYIIGPRRPKLF